MKRSQRGFTLIEMMVVVGIIGIVSALMVSVSSRTVGASAKTVSEQVVTMVNLAKLRAQATRRIHRVQIEPQRISLWSVSTTGLVLPTTPVWSMVEFVTIPPAVTIYDVVGSAVTTTGASVSVNTSLLYPLDVRPDGQATASTVYVSDGPHTMRVLTYHVTGGTYARENW